jgi:uncharacterized protein (DUF1697 family)
MTKYIAFLRAINVGGHNVKMTELKKLFESLEFSNVETFIASGNVIFDTPAKNPAKDTVKLEKKIEALLKGALGYEVFTFLRTPGEVAAIAKYKPFKTKGEALNVAFITEPLDDLPIQKLLALKNEIDDFHVHGREIYWLRQIKPTESKFSNMVLEKTIGRRATVRGINTIQKMAEKYC